jgi:hypothetical protein
MGKFYNFGVIVILTGNDLVGEVFKGIERPNEIREEIQAKRNNSK